MYECECKMTGYLNQDESFRYKGQKTLLAPTALHEDDLLDDKGIFLYFSKYTCTRFSFICSYRNLALVPIYT